MAQKHSTVDLREKIAASLKLTPDELAQKLPSGVQSVFANRIAWATVYLAKAGALKRLRRDVFEITDRGRELLQTHPEKITLHILSDYPEFVAFHLNYAQTKIRVLRI